MPASLVVFAAFVFAAWTPGCGTSSSPDTEANTSLEAPPSENIEAFLEEPTYSGGGIDGISGNVVSGWCAVTRGAQRLSSAVNVRQGGTQIGSTVTSVDRPEIKAFIEGEYRKTGSSMTLADGFFGFTYKLETAGTYSFECVGGPTLPDVVFSPPTPPTEPPPPPTFEGGALDRLDGDVQFGWCGVTVGADRVVTSVDVYLNDRYLDTVDLDQHRTDAKDLIEEDYLRQGSFATLQTDLFGFTYPLGAPGTYAFLCGEDTVFEREYAGTEPSDPPPYVPEASGGWIDRLDGGTKAVGWCAVTRGQDRLSETVDVFFNGQHRGSTRTTIPRPDVKAALEENYREQGSFTTLRDDLFGFEYVIAGAGIYTFDCGQEEDLRLDTANPPTSGPPPEFRGGNIDRERGGVVEGWCAVTRGHARLSTQVVVRLNGSHHGVASTDRVRTDAKRYIEEKYRYAGSYSVLDDALFGFVYTVDRLGTYTFNCGGDDLAMTFEPVRIDQCWQSATEFSVSVSVPSGRPRPHVSNINDGHENAWAELLQDRWIPSTENGRDVYRLTKNGTTTVEKSLYTGITSAQFRFRTGPSDPTPNVMAAQTCTIDF